MVIFHFSRIRIMCVCVCFLVVQALLYKLKIAPCFFSVIFNVKQQLITCCTHAHRTLHTVDTFTRLTKTRKSADSQRRNRFFLKITVVCVCKVFAWWTTSQHHIKCAACTHCLCHLSPILPFIFISFCFDSIFASIIHCVLCAPKLIVYNDRTGTANPGLNVAQDWFVNYMVCIENWKNSDSVPFPFRSVPSESTWKFASFLFSLCATNAQQLIKHSHSHCECIMTPFNLYSISHVDVIKICTENIRCIMFHNQRLRIWECSNCSLTAVQAMHSKSPKVLRSKRPLTKSCGEKSAHRRGRPCHTIKWEKKINHGSR